MNSEKERDKTVESEKRHISQETLVDIHGSCVSYYPIHKKNPKYETWKLDGIKSNLYYVYCSIPSSMTVPIAINPDGYNFNMDRFFERNLKADLKKVAIPSLLDSEAEWLMIDLYDWTRAHEMYNDGCYAHTSHLSVVAPDFYNAAKNELKPGWFRWIDIPFFIWKQKIIDYMDIMTKRYGNRIILNRINMNRYSINSLNDVSELDHSADGYYGGYKDNEILREIEDFLIENWDIKSIDIAKYYITDERTDGDLLAVHYERDYYRLAGKYIKCIIDGKDGDYDVLDVEGAAYKWRRYKSLSMDSSEKYINAVDIPKTGYNFFDKLLEQLDVHLLKELGDEIADIYIMMGKNDSYFSNSNISLKDKSDMCIELIKEAITKLGIS